MTRLPLFDLTDSCVLLSQKSYQVLEEIYNAIVSSQKNSGGGAVLQRQQQAMPVIWFFCNAKSVFWKLCLSALTSTGGVNSGLFRKVGSGPSQITVAKTVSCLGRWAYGPHKQGGVTI